MESPEKALDAGKHDRTGIARPAEAQPVFGLHASFEAARHAPLMGGPRLSIAHPKDGSLRRASPTNPDVGARHERPYARPRSFRAREDRDCDRRGAFGPACLVPDLARGM